MYQFTVIKFGAGWAYGTVGITVGKLEFSKRALCNVSGELTIGMKFDVPKEFVRFQEDIAE